MQPHTLSQDERQEEPVAPETGLSSVPEAEGTVNNSTPGPAFATLAQLLVEAAIQRPEADALIGEFGSLSYADLLIRAQNIAVALRKQGVSSGDLVGVAMDQSPVTITAIAGVLLAGAAYAPLGRDLLQDEESLKTIRGLGMRLILCDASHGTGSCTLWSDLGAVLDASRMEQETMPSSSETRLPTLSPEATAAVLFRRAYGEKTLGVMVPHRAIARLCAPSHLIESYVGETLVLHSASNQRPALLELWGSLLNGATLLVAPKQRDALATSIRTYGVTTLCLPVAALHELIDSAPKTFLRLRNLVIEQDGSQSVLSPQRLEWLSNAYPRLRIVHSYGTWETSGYATGYLVPPSYEARAAVPIGTPLQGMQAIVLDRELFPAREGEIGELAFAGDHVVTGYIKDQDATAQRFLRRATVETSAATSSKDAAESLLFITGVRARRRTDGLLELHGPAAVRAAKVVAEPVPAPRNGFSFADIEAMLMSQQRVRDAAIMERKDGQHVAVVALDPQHAETHEAIRTAIEDSMRNTLPPAAMPVVFQYVESIPRDASGALEPGRLAPVQETGPVLLQERRDESRAILDQVRTLWSRLLQRDAVDDEEDFFHAGGTQVQMIRMQVELNRRFPGAITMANLPVLRTIRSIHGHLLNLPKQNRGMNVAAPVLNRRGA